MSGKRKRRRRWASEKPRIVLAGMQGGVEVSELCRREGINPTMYYGWRKKLLSAGSSAQRRRELLSAGVDNGRLSGVDFTGSERSFR